jgi:hypothetical protein
MAAGNRNPGAVVHPGASLQAQWPIMKHPIALWQDEESFERRGDTWCCWGILWCGGSVGSRRRGDLIP